jgi:Na+/H+ antiporter NhaC
LAGATFGDFFAPISDTTIASALSQKAEIGPTVRSRIKYIIPASIMSLICIVISAYLQEGNLAAEAIENHGSPQGLLMLLVPILIIYLFLKGKHLFHGLMMGLLFGTALGLVSGLLPLKEILSLDLDNMVAQSFIIKGINRSVGLSIFTILLMGMVGTLKASGVFDELINYAQDKGSQPRHSEGWIAGMAGIAVLLTTHSIVAILMVSEFTNKVGQKWKIPPIRRSNILSVVVCIFPFLLPYFIPVILMSSMTGTAQDIGIPNVSPLLVGFHNFLAWGLIPVIIAMVFFGFGRKQDG